jgi:tRNA modification GTPase
LASYSEYSDIIIAPITSSHSKQRTALRLSGYSLPELIKGIFKEEIDFKYGAFKQSLKLSLDEISDINFEVMVFTMPKNCSFTHEPVVELHYPSNETITVTILELFYKMGVKPASPGEFTKRAFLNGRLALSQANSIAALVASKTEAQRKKATKLLNGSEDDFVIVLKEHLFELRRNLEAVIDFPEEPDIDHKQFVWKDCISNVEAHIHSYDKKLNREPFQNYSQIIILGLANAGKSSLIKSLIPASTPVISHIPGTTLDLIPYQMELEGQTIVLYDSPGFKDAENTLDDLSLQQLKKRIHSFDACIFLHTEKNNVDYWWADKKDFSFFLDVQSKADINSCNPEDFAISSLTGYGLDALKNRIVEYSIQNQNEAQSPWQALEKRISNLVKEKLTMIKARLFEANDEEELAAYDLDELLVELNELLYQDGGSEPLLDSIFKNFCIGK